jgi:hypothetical protein
MNNEDKRWLVEVFPTHRGRTIKGDTLAAYYRAEMLIEGRDKINKRGCSCEFRGMTQHVDNIYNKWLFDEKNNANTGTI